MFRASVQAGRGWAGFPARATASAAQRPCHPRSHLIRLPSQPSFHAWSSPLPHLQSPQAPQLLVLFHAGAFAPSQESPSLPGRDPTPDVLRLLGVLGNDIPDTKVPVRDSWPLFLEGSKCSVPLTVETQGCYRRPCPCCSQGDLCHCPLSSPGLWSRIHSSGKGLCSQVIEGKNEPMTPLAAHDQQPDSPTLSPRGVRAPDGEENPRLPLIGHDLSSEAEAPAVSISHS